MRPMSSRPRQRAPPSVAQRSASYGRDRGVAVAQALQHQRMARRLHDVRGIVRRRAVDPEADRRRRPPRVPASGRSRRRTPCRTPARWADADARAPEPADLVGVEMDRRARPRFAARASRRPPEGRPSACRTSASRRRPRPATGRGGSAGGRRSARRAPPIRSSTRCGTASGEQGASATRTSAPGLRIVVAPRARARCPSRIASELCTIESGCRPPSFSEMPIEPRVTVIRMPERLRLFDLDVDRRSRGRGGKRL